MPHSPAILAIDQGTTSSRAIVFDEHATIVSVAQEEFEQIFPDNGWVEHDPEAIWNSTLAVCRKAIAEAGARGVRIVAAGITNQRETVIVWDRETGRPISNAIVWQDRRTAPVCEDLKRQGVEADIQRRTGLLIDPYFSATKIAWLLDNIDGAREQASAGKLAFGTVDTYLLWKLTDGRVHATDATNASRTSLYNIDTQSWDDELLDLFRVPRAVLPDVLDSNAEFGAIDPALLGIDCPIRGVAGDQQAAVIGQACFETGDIKSTYGTGCFVVLNTGERRLHSNNRLLSTIAYQIDGKVTYALEGSIFVAGAAIQWLRDGLGLIQSADETDELSRGLSSNGGVFVVPAFTGIGAPHWNPDVRGAIFGLTRASGPAELVRATIESVCYQTADLFTAMAQDGVTPKALKVDGGMVANDWMCAFLSSILDLPVDRPTIMETTALGAAYLAGMKSGIYGSLDEIRKTWHLDRRFEGTMDEAERRKLMATWHKAVEAAVQFSA